MKLFTFIFILSFIVYGCTRSNELEQQLLDNKDCITPCLLGITPGNTSEIETKAIISNNDLFRNCQEFDYTSEGGFRGIECKSIVMTFDSGFISQIGLNLSGTSLEQVINKYGSPDYLEVIKGNLPDAPDKIKAILWYKNIQTQVTLTEHAGDIYPINSTTKIESITCYDENRYGDLTNSLTDSQLWQGYGNYSEKLPK